MGTFTDLPAGLMTERLRLRRWKPSDAEDYRGLWLERDARSLRRINAHGHPSVDDFRSLLIDNPLVAEPGLGLLVMERRDNGEFLGYCGLIIGEGSFDEPEIAFELARRWQGHGYTTEAARAVVDAAALTGRSRLWATVREWNAASFRVLEKLDFHRSGRVTPDAERRDSIWMTRALTVGRGGTSDLT